MIMQSEPENQVKDQISEKEFYNVSDFELKSLQRVGF